MDSDECTTSINLNAWTWLLVHTVVFGGDSMLKIINVLVNMWYLERFGSLRPPLKIPLLQLIKLAKTIFQFAWWVTGFVLLDGIDQGCPSSVKSMILAACLLDLFMVLVIIAVMLMCMPCLSGLTVLLLRAKGARALDDQEMASALVSEIYEENEGETCSICLEAFTAGETIKRISVCQHRYHGSCIDPWIRDNNNCPLCRRVVEMGSVSSPV